MENTDSDSAAVKNSPLSADGGGLDERRLAEAAEESQAAVRDENIPLAFLRWGKKYSWRRPLFSDVKQRPNSYRKTYRSAWALGAVIAERHANSAVDSSGGESENKNAIKNPIGVLLPSSSGAAIVFYAALMRRLTPVMLNPGGAQTLLSACETAQLRTVYTSQKLLDNSSAAAEAAALLRENGVEVVCLESLRPMVGLGLKLRALAASLFPSYSIPRLAGAAAKADDIAAVLFTSGSESRPKGVALSHRNLLANAAQVLARLDYLDGETMLNSLPIFHSFGLLAGTLLPAAGGMHVLHYPTPLHYRRIPQVIADFRPTVFFSADSFMSSYAREATAAQMQSLRHVFAGAEKLKESTRREWLEKFGVMILEGYGVTEASPVIAVNTPTANRPGSVGRPLSHVELKLSPMEGVKNGGRLLARGPNIMRGYVLHESPGELRPPPDGWHDTGDIAELDEDGFLHIRGRARRFVKIAGEMAPLDGIEEALSEAWPSRVFAAVAVPDKTRGEQIAVLCAPRPADEESETIGDNDEPITREKIAATFRAAGLPSLWVPRQTLNIKTLPRLPAGKPDYPAAEKIAKAEIRQDNP